MQKDYTPSTKYTPDDFEAIEMNYKYQDNCKDEYADYLICVKSRPQILENQFTYVLPFSQYYTKCRILRDQWLGCQDYREKQLYEHLRGIFEAQKNSV